jgi:Leucine-rich repeat (LRR) protein
MDLKNEENMNINSVILPRNLQTINFENNALSDVSDVFFQFKKLKSLNLSFNLIKDIRQKL